LPTSGRITVRGIDVVDNPHEIRRFVGYLPERPPVYSDMTVGEYLDFAGRLRGLDGHQADKRAAEVVDACNLTKVVDSVIGTLSHGFQQRVGIAQAIIHRPALLILDEPIQGLDPVQIVDMRNLIANLRGEHTILLSTHILSEIEQTCDRILMMHKGRIAAEGTEDELLACYGAAQMLELEVRGDETAITTALASVPEVSDVKLMTNEGGVVHLQLRVIDSARENVSRAVVQAGLGLNAMRPLATGLEGVFVSLSSGNATLKDAAASPASKLDNAETSAS
jgi:ABC-2 type transport system ATP-binding protein